MKKFLVFICLLALISFAGAAFAEGGHGGHVDANAEINTTPAAKTPYKPVSDDIKATGGTVELVEGNISTPTEFKAADIYLPTTTANKVAVMSNVKINVTVDPGATEVIIKFANYADTNTEDLYAFIKAHTTSGDYTKDKFYAFKCTVTDKVLSFTVTNPEVFFSENTVVLATVKTVPTSSGSSGGCNAGYTGLLLFAAVPFLFRKKK
ncbi:MAG: SYNERG-CTERM sorting domain-containing protein [Synergistaceae bacterium]|nr:SYNERG-CTERM sorting domain-containing protein [Synergistaceae bacterium]